MISYLAAQPMQLPVFNAMIIRMIEIENAYAAEDASVKVSSIGGYWYLTNIEKEEKIEYSIYSN